MNPIDREIMPPSEVQAYYAGLPEVVGIFAIIVPSIRREERVGTVATASIATATVSPPSAGVDRVE
jgi:hypothetical protein